jgi:hypothetical protein
VLGADSKRNALTAWVRLQRTLHVRVTPTLAIRYGALIRPASLEPLYKRFGDHESNDMAGIAQQRRRWLGDATVIRRERLRRLSIVGCGSPNEIRS